MSCLHFEHMTQGEDNSNLAPGREEPNLSILGGLKDETKIRQSSTTSQLNRSLFCLDCFIAICIICSRLFLSTDLLLFQ